MTLAERAYFLWLFRRVDPDYSNLSRYLHTKPFIAVIDLDDNRIGDALREREIFIDTVNHGLSAKDVNELMSMPVSIFEVLVAIAIRIDFIMDDLISPPRVDEWYHELLKNLELDYLSDDHWRNTPLLLEEIDERLNVFMYREYGDDGKGSLFPITSDVIVGWKSIELWYQMNQWLAQK